VRHSRGPRVLRTLFGLSLSVLPVFASPSSTPDSPDRPAPLLQQQTIPIRVYRGFLVVAEGHFGNILQHQNFVIDTGTSPSIINSRLAGALDLRMSAAVLASVGRDSNVKQALLAEIDIGPIRASALPVFVSDLSALEKDLGIPVAGVIGLDVLSKASFRLDYQKKRIEFGRFAPGGVAVRLPAGAGIAVAQVTWGGVPVRLMVDTGSDQLVLLGKEPPVFTASITAASVTDKLSVQELPPAEIVVAGKRFSRAKAYWVPGSDTSDFDGLLGVRALGFRSLSFDSEHRTIHLSQ
jgi:hypothetical protein